MLAFAVLEQVASLLGIGAPALQSLHQAAVRLFTSSESFGPEGLAPMDLNSVLASFLLRFSLWDNLRLPYAFSPCSAHQRF